MSINVLSLFDGISCAKVALDNLGINHAYFASEIDTKTHLISAANHKGIKNLWDIKNISYKNNNLCYVDGSHNVKIDLVIGGSSCQSLSAAARNPRSGLYSGQSTVFWEYLRVLKETCPKYFVLENVASMKARDRDIITKELQAYDSGTQLHKIDSALFTAQSRKRLYWTNIPNITEKKDNRVILSSVLDPKNDHESKLFIKNKPGLLHPVSLTYNLRPKRIGLLQNKSGVNLNSQGYRIYYHHGKSATLTASGGGPGHHTGAYLINNGIRRLSVQEACLLQGLPYDYCDKTNISYTDKYKALGNAFTVPVIKHILSHMR